MLIHLLVLTAMPSWQEIPLYISFQLGISRTDSVLVEGERSDLPDFGQYRCYHAARRYELLWIW